MHLYFHAAAFSRDIYENDIMKIAHPLQILCISVTTIPMKEADFAHRMTTCPLPRFSSIPPAHQTLKV
jgi:hypothetical protein